MAESERLPSAVQERLPAVYRGSAIEQRYTCVPDYGREDPEAFTFFPKDWSLEPAPTTEERNERYREAAIPLAQDVGQEALDHADVAPSEITHVIAVSCTGFFAPGLDVELVKRLDLPSSTRRTFIGFMGCYAAFNALRVAHGFCQSQPDARVLIVCVELCTLHFQIDSTLESVVVNSLFSDGAAGAVLSARPRAETKGKMVYVDGCCHLDDDSLEDMTWTIGDTGFKMGLSSRVPDVVGRRLPRFVNDLLAPRGLERGDVDFWAIHPGGRRIVERAREALDLSDADVAASLEVLRRYGNMSSPTVLFVLEHILQRSSRGDGSPPGRGIAMAFGPGLTIEGALFERV